jgi:hypothetical protein
VTPPRREGAKRKRRKRRKRRRRRRSGAGIRGLGRTREARERGSVEVVVPSEERKKSDEGAGERSGYSLSLAARIAAAAPPG